MSDKELTVSSDIMNKLLEYYDEDLKPHLIFTEAEEKKIIKYVNKIACGSIAYAPLVCVGVTKCIYKTSCPVADKSPIGHPCPFEQLVLQQWYDEYIKSLEVDINDKTERTQITELVEADLLAARANAMLSTDGLIMENAIGIEPDTGNVIYRKEEHLALNIKQRAQLRRDKILKSFIATRESKVKATKGNLQDPTVHYAKLREMMDKIQMRNNAINVTTEEVKNEPIKTDDIQTPAGDKQG